MATSPPPSGGNIVPAHPVSRAQADAVHSTDVLRMQLQVSADSATALREELAREKEEKVRLAQQLIHNIQSGGYQSTPPPPQSFAAPPAAAAAPPPPFEQEQQQRAAYAQVTVDELVRLQTLCAERERQLAQRVAEAEHAQTRCKELTEKLETQTLTNDAQSHIAQQELEGERERLNEVVLELMNTKNAHRTVEIRVQELEQAKDGAASTEEEQRARAEAAEVSLEEARAEVVGVREELSRVKLDAEQRELQAEQDTLALHRQSAQLASDQFEEMKTLQEELETTKRERDAASEDRELLRLKEIDLQRQLTAQLEQVERLQHHCDALFQSDEGDTDKGQRVRRARQKPARRVRGGSGGGDGHAEAEASEASESGDASVGMEGAEIGALVGQEDEEGVAESGSVDGVERVEAEEKQDVSTAAAEGAAEGAASALARELHEYEAIATSSLKANRALIEAYWRLRLLVLEAQREGQPVQLPSHEDLGLQLLIDPHSGRREVPSEAERALEREKARLEAQLARARQGLEQHNELAELSLAGQQKNSAALSKEKAELSEQLASASASEQELRDQIASLEAEASEPAASEVRSLRVQKAELLTAHAKLERERSELIRRATFAEEQLAQIQNYLSTNITRYQKEILRLRDSEQPRN